MEEKGKANVTFPSLDIVTDHSDHYYTNRRDFGNNAHSCHAYFQNASSAVHKKIMKEWKILQNDLPESIYVRVYEQRIDLLRAAIVGPSGTPYHDGLFFFDLAFPTDYPNRPPFVRYLSFGYCINPNLYENGYVCLSLLNTWSGGKSQRWNPSQSTVLQVLVSIQGLVLNDQPFFNEPVVLNVRFLKKMSLKYNENVFRYSCKSMLHLLQRPPNNFEELVATHFRERAPVIVMACDAYMNNGVRVGHYGANGSSKSVVKSNVSSSFMVAMKPLFDQLVVAFTKNGASLGHLVERSRNDSEIMTNKRGKKQQKSSEASSNRNAKMVKEKEKKFVGKLFAKFKKIFGLKRNGK